MGTALQKVLTLMDNSHERRRGHFQRGRQGPDRRGQDRRPPQPRTQERPGRDQVDVEQIMRDIRGRIAQRQGIDLSNQQIQDLAARRLESILDPRAIKPSLLDALRRTAGTTGPRGADKVPNEPMFTFEDTTIYDSHRGVLRLVRRLLNPLLKLFFNPNPLIRALHLQARLNVEAAERDAERDSRQTEWNALHYEIVQRLVTEVSRVSLELQSLTMRVESLDAKLEFNERRIRSIEGSAQRSRPQSRPAEPVAASPAVMEGETAPADAAIPAVEGQPSEGSKRRRRRRRGRRPGTAPAGAAAPFAAPLSVGDPEAPVAAHTGPLPAVEHPAQNAEVAQVLLERPVEMPQEPRDSAPPQPPPLSLPPASDERAAHEPPARQPDPDRTEP